jgi:hypothetical protein
VSPIAIVLLAAAGALLIATEWRAMSRRLGRDGRSARQRQRRKAGLRVVPSLRDDGLHDEDDFVRAVERDLAALPTIDERDLRKPKT